MKLDILGAVSSLERDGLICGREMEDVFASENQGIPAHTIGYETEVLPSAVDDISSLTDTRKSADDLKIHAYNSAYRQMRPYGYGVCSDGLYELQSPPAKHPYPLIVATRGLARAGWLPSDAGTTGCVTSHVSIGTPIAAQSLIRSDTDSGIDFLQDTALLLRNVEMMDGTIPGRLTSPLRRAAENHTSTTEYSWNQKGDYGFMVDDDPAAARRLFSEKTWKGANNRIEFRTLSYYNPRQFSVLLNAVYYLSRGFLDINEPAANDIYLDHNEWFKDYCDDHGLPIEIYRPDDSLYVDDLAEYIVPYAEHLRSQSLSEVRSRTNQAILDIREELHMTNIPIDIIDSTSGSI